MTFISDMNGSGHSRHAVDNSANQCDVSGSNRSLCSALTTVVLVAGALLALWGFPMPWENWLVIGIVGAALVACALIRYSIHRRQSKLVA